MNKIILLIGDSGSGKDFVLSIANEYDDIEVIKRLISRDPRDGEDNSISAIFSVPIDDIKKTDYFYEGAEQGRWYGIEKARFDRVLESGKSPMAICPNYENYLQILRDYPNRVVTFFIYRGYDDSELDSWRESLLARGSSSEEIEAREKTRDKYFRELYINHFEDYSSNVILNIYGLTTKEDIKLQIEGLCEKNDINIDSIQKSQINR